MNYTDNKIIYNLFCNNILLQYLDISDKAELSSACKFIFQKCAIFRLSNYNIDSNDFEKASKNTSAEVELFEDVYNNKMEYINTTITKAFI
ncbi:hypothetical protein CONCODRAFT_6412 [Conidiobolus coronatus NRRL 28638]|uniref:Uncharacterized protein n=1 Tax=Conidiobolus coronatus (strain ATCC 28846 / CBS 209.66 / NRRL 28638) TaxID=796925 RepID=A0A137P7K0_CONC2|nr:hypothetical protein CONCODRAFT_6412 [Conidiobolus coronatus NRRL 28638]|eukprot:KXN70965.1 hypothetical protein CONCODRAFT_6412 [Conidiobolus coronatus NRRL 28638]